MKGFYNSTDGFVITNKLEDKANECFGEGWEAEDDVEQIQQLLDFIGSNELMVKFIPNKNEDDIEVCNRKFKLSIDDFKDLKYLITQKLVEEGIVKDCTDTDDEDEVNTENAIQEVFIEFIKFNYSN